MVNIINEIENHKASLTGLLLKLEQPIVVIAGFFINMCVNMIDVVRQYLDDTNRFEMVEYIPKLEEWKRKLKELESKMSDNT